MFVFSLMTVSKINCTHIHSFAVKFIKAGFNVSLLSTDL